jgi:CRISPR-associated protein Cas1
MTVVYFQCQGAKVVRNNGLLCLETQNNILAETLIKDIDSLVIIGHIALTAQAVDAILFNGIPTSFLSLRGRYKGRLAPAGDKNVPLRLKQYNTHLDQELSLNLAKTIVRAKIQNSAAVLRVFLRNHPDEYVSSTRKSLLESIPAIEKSQNKDELMGIEGEASRRYFSVFGHMCLGEMKFEGRTRRPPKDPANAILSFAYGLIMAELAANLASVGLDPDIGFYHALKYGRPALALDLVEEFRQPLADRLVLFVNNNRMLKLADFEPVEEGGIRLKEEARKKFLAAYEQFVTEQLRTGARQQTFRQIFQIQAQNLRKWLETGVEYRPFLLEE